MAKKNEGWTENKLRLRLKRHSCYVAPLYIGANIITYVNEDNNTC